MQSVEIRTQLVDALRLDLIGPDAVRKLGTLEEVLSQSPSRWYLGGFLVPLDAGEAQRSDEAGGEDLDEMSEAGGTDDKTTPEPAAARRSYMPSSIGLSVLVPASLRQMQVTVRWGDYRVGSCQLAVVRQDNGLASDNCQPTTDNYSDNCQPTTDNCSWRRTPREEQVTLDLPEKTSAPVEVEVPNSANLRLALMVRPVHSDGRESGLPPGTRSVSIFLVNRRKPDPDETRDHAFAFQVQLEIAAEEPLVPRPDVRGLESNDPDDRVADLQYRDAFEFAVGHSVAAEAIVSDGVCRRVWTCWIPEAEVERVAPAKIDGVERSMDALAQLADVDDARAKLGGFVAQYRRWISDQRGKMPHSPARRKETGEELLRLAGIAADRIERGIALLADPQCLEAFRIANRVMARAVRQRAVVSSQLSVAREDTGRINSPPTTDNRQPTTASWRPFQLAFLLMNLPGIADPTDADRGVVDLLFFPTGGGKTEAYLGLAAFTMVLRRLRNPRIASAGLSVLMRYTLRLLTLDQLGRATTLICALELERQQDVEKLGEWPFEIGLWVGQAATPNRMGHKGDGDSYSARTKTIAFKNDDRKPSPIPLEECPWCGTKFTRNSFHLAPNPDHPTDLRVVCTNRRCEFSRGQPLPMLAVDESIYRRLPCFMIATVDKFAAMPWTGEVGAFFGRVNRVDKDGFYGPCEPTQGHPLPGGRLLPPDLVIQDELHLISGPLGTMVGLYETALDELCSREVDGHTIRPKIVASTATVRRAETQIRALFNRRQVDIFPPPGPDRRDSFFAHVHTPQQSNPRLYVGIAAQGRSPKVVMLRVYLVLLAAAQRAYSKLGGKKAAINPADPYMTVLGYFNSLRELGGARRVVEDEVGNRLTGYGNRKRVGETDSAFENRRISYEPVELTSRVSTNKVAEAKRLLAQSFASDDRVDVALATNMISVGLDITRLGLMVVSGQPKTSAEYIQATSRVGRDAGRPGLVVTILNIHKPRDRSHYERFAAYHQSFYRSVEATSVTPFSSRALDRGLAGALVALARQGHAPMTPARGASAILQEFACLDFVAECLAERAACCVDRPEPEAEEIRLRVRSRARNLLEEWSKIAQELGQVGGGLQYQVEVGKAARLLYEFLNPELKMLPPRRRLFRANRSMRDVEPSVNLWVKNLDGIELEEEEEA
jgi:hypothetical protein